MGYETWLQPFAFNLSAEPTEASLMGLGTDGKRFLALSMDFSPSGEVQGQLVHVGLAMENDTPPKGLAGKIALIQRGDITFREKVERVANAGAVGAVIYNNLTGQFHGTLYTKSAIPAVSVSLEDSGGLLEAAADAAVFRLSVADTHAPSQNIIAEKSGRGNGVVIIGAHYDTVPDSPGANDNGSGISTVLTVAEELANESFPFTLRFILFGAEEVGVQGSTHYIRNISEAERHRIIAMLNFDALGSGPVTAVFGSTDLAAALIQYGEANGIAVERRHDIGRFYSDHVPFVNAGVPALFFLADDFSRVNSPDDHIEFVEPQRMGDAAALLIGALHELAIER